MSDNKLPQNVPAHEPFKEDMPAAGSSASAVWKKIGKVSLRVLTYVMNALLTILLIGAVCGIIVGTVFCIYIKNYVDPEVDPSLLVSAGSDKTTRIYYMDYETEDDRINQNGTPKEIEDQRLYSSDNSIWASYDQMPADLINAFTSVEDHRFFDHNGVDWLRTGKAVFGYFFGAGDFGGSTITQQLIKNLTGEKENSIQRKVQEIFRALNLEKKMSKEEIIEMYLNIVFLGNNCYGVQAASNTYFGKDVSELSLVECASLAAIVKNPAKYEPKHHDVVMYEQENGEEKEDGNRARRNTVLYTMLQYGKINQAQFDEATETDLVLYSKEDDTGADSATHINSWYTDAVIADVQDALMEKNGWTSYAASLAIYNGGLKIYTCMDPKVQGVLEEVYVNDSQHFPHATSGLQPESSMIVLDPYTGDVLGLVGGRGEKTQNRILDRATQAKRPVGSSIKPLSVYAPGVDLEVITMGSIYDDTPVKTSDTGVPWPRNLPNVYGGLTTIQDAVRRSVNTIAVRVLQDITVDYSFDFLKNTLHMDNVIDSHTKQSGQVVSDKDLAPLALGQFSYGITLWELTAGYDMFLNEGVYSKSRLWYKVLDSDGNVVLENEPDYEIAISEEAASIMTKMLQGVVSDGTGRAVTVDQYVEVAGKTGTTTADFDRTFVGYTPYYLGGVWVGYDMNQALSDFGTNPAVQVWDKVMTMLHEDIFARVRAGEEELKTFKMSDRLVECTYCRYSGKLTSNGCWGEKGYFTKDTVPTEYCYGHGG